MIVGRRPAITHHRGAVVRDGGDGGLEVMGDGGDGWLEVMGDGGWADSLQDPSEAALDYAGG